MNISGLQSGGQFGDGESRRFVLPLLPNGLTDWDALGYFNILLLDVNTKKLSALLSPDPFSYPPLTVKLRKIVHYMIFVRVAMKIEKITNNQTLKDSFCVAITNFSKLLFVEYNRTRANDDFDQIEKAIKQVYKLAINPSELNVKIMATNVEKSYCLPCAKFQEWVMGDSMMQKATRLLSNYQTAYDNIRVLLES